MNNDPLIKRKDFAVCMRDGYTMAYFDTHAEAAQHRVTLSEEGIAYLQETMTIRTRDGYRYPM